MRYGTVRRTSSSEVMPARALSRPLSSRVFIPFSTAQIRVFGTDRVQSILVQAASEEEIGLALAEIDTTSGALYLKAGSVLDFETAGNTLAVLVWDAYDVPARPTWVDDVKPVLPRYANLYPSMRDILDPRLGPMVVTTEQLEQRIAETEERFGAESRRIVLRDRLEHPRGIGVPLRGEIHRPQRVRGGIELGEVGIAPNQIFETRDRRLVVRQSEGW